MREWQQFLSELEQELGPEIVKKWVPEVTHFDAQNIYLKVKDSFQANWFNEHVAPHLKKLVNNNQRPIKVHLVSPPKPQLKEEERTFFSPDSVDPEMSFENYLSTPENALAYQLLKENSPFNPIFLYGPKNVGKTHLLMAAANFWKNKGKKVFFVQAETFTEHVVQAMRLGKMQEFRKVYRGIDLLIVDNVDIFSRRTATQEEFFHTFNTLHTSGQMILLSANGAPSQLKEIEPRLISRFEWGITLPLHPATTKLILEKKAAQWKTTLTPDLIEFLMEKCSNNPIQALVALIMRAKTTHLNTQIAEQWLRDFIQKNQENVLTFERIVKSVANHYGIKSEDILGKSQMKEYAQPRQMAMYLTREKLELPFKKIGELFQRDHSTVMSSIKQVQKGIDEKKIDPQIIQSLRS